MSVSYAEVLCTARDLVEEETLAEGFSNEYLRGAVNLIADAFSTVGMDTAERMDEVLADLRRLPFGSNPSGLAQYGVEICESCGDHLAILYGDECVELRQHAPEGAPAHDAMCDDEPGLRCRNVMCPRFAVTVSPELQSNDPEEESS